MRDEIIARVLFTDGIWRNVYKQSDGRQYVFDQDAEPAFGVWFIPPFRPKGPGRSNSRARSLRSAEEGRQKTAGIVPPGPLQ